jgi:hypothetical protein
VTHGQKTYVYVLDRKFWLEFSEQESTFFNFIKNKEFSSENELSINLEKLRKLSQSQVKGFLLGYFDENKEVNCTNAQNYKTLFSLGMFCGLHIKSNGFMLQLSKEKDFLLDTVTYITDSENETFDIEVEDVHHYIAQGVVSHNTLSLLGGVTPGCHPAYSQFYIRRVRFASDSPLLDVLTKNGYYMEYVQNFDGTNDYTTKVVEFPIKVPDGTILAKDMTAIKQLEVVKRLQTEWADNAVSVTVYYKKEELPEIKEWLNKNYNENIKAVSFLLHSDHGFKQAPYEEISKEEYEKRSKGLKEIFSLEDSSMVSDDLNEECAGGACPIK